MSQNGLPTREQPSDCNGPNKACEATHDALKKLPIETEDGRNPFRITLKPWETIVCRHLQGESSFKDFFGGAGFRPPTE